MRWILFWIFLVAFIIIFLATTATVFLGFGQCTQDERSLLFKTFIIEIGIAVAALFYALFGLKRAGDGALERVEAEEALPESYKFSIIYTEISETVSKLEAENGRLAQWYIARGDAERLFQGLYSSLLYASTASVTGTVNSQFYGNMMEWDSLQRQLRVRFFFGPYNDEIITRKFPIEGPGQGVASEALITGKVQIKNRMESELKEKGEARLSSMVSIPVPDFEPSRNSRQIVILNIDAGIVGVFPDLDKWTSSEMKSRIEQLRLLVSRVNKLYTSYFEQAK